VHPLAAVSTRSAERSAFTLSRIGHHRSGDRQPCGRCPL